LLTGVCFRPAVAQAPPALTTLPSAEQVIQRNQDPFAGSIPQGKATADVIELSIEDALNRGLKYNLGLYFSDRATEQSRAAQLRALSELLPVVNGSVTEEIQKINLKAFGFTFGGFPSSVGPFSLFELQAGGHWNPLDLHYISGVRAAAQNVKASQFAYRDARDAVVLAVGANYLLTIAYESRVTAAQAELQSAQALYQLAVDQENAGLAPNIDTLRARVQLQTQISQLIQAQNDLEKQRIALARVIGLPVRQKFRIVNQVPYHDLSQEDIANAFERALQTRSDYQAALASLRSAQLTLDSAWQQRLPSIGFTGNYGVLGFNPNGLAPNWAAAATLAIPIFQGGKVEADVEQSRSIVKQRQAQVDNLRGSIEQDVENALLDLRAAAEQVEVARVGLDFAQQALQQSQDRFAAGVTNNVEVIQAQQQLASANEQYIASLYEHNIAKVLLARAIGNAESAVRQYLSQPGNVVPSQPAPPSAPNMPSPAAPGTTPNTPAPATPGATPNAPGPTTPGTPSGGTAATTSGQMTAPAPEPVPAPSLSQRMQDERSSLTLAGHVSEVRQVK
jgi:outer membrane protein TolC